MILRIVVMLETVACGAERDVENWLVTSLQLLLPFGGHFWGCFHGGEAIDGEGGGVRWVVGCC